MVEHRTTSALSFLDLIDICDNVHLRSGVFLEDVAYSCEPLVPFCISESAESPVVGLLRPVIIEQLELENERYRLLDFPDLWVIRLDEGSFKRRRKDGTLGPSVSFNGWINTPSRRTSAMQELCERWRDNGLFKDVCGPKKWRDELYPVYADPFGPHDHPSDANLGDEFNFMFEMERSACALFGIITYGVHMSIYEMIDSAPATEQKSLRIWVPTRAKTKQTWPGYLDNSVAGGIPSGMSIFESLVKECMEEASIPAEIVIKYTRAVGAISYFFRTSTGWLQPEIEYVYELVIPPGVDQTPFQPKPSDGEVESFELISQDLLIEKLRQGLFKPNCALVLIDLLIRLGHITPDNEGNYVEIMTRLHGRFDFDLW